MNNYLKLYLKSTIALARGVRIKSNTTAQAVNTKLISEGWEVDEVRPETWRYYLNLAGIYHPSNTMMTVISHDTYEVIEFTKENLSRHLLTKRSYNVDSQYFRELKARYPDQEILIQGIVDPVDIDEAIKANDHTILTYPVRFVESNEGYLIPSLQRYIDNFFSTRSNPDYAIFDKFYYVKLLSGLATKLVLEILRLRMTACKTDRAHSFHVRQFLMSYSDIGKEFHYMNHTQRMWFYRNIRYINRNIGKSETFKELVKRVMSARGFSLVGYDLAKTTEGLLENLKPKAEFSQVQINHILPASGAGSKEVRTILSREMSSAPDNYVVIDENTLTATEVGETSLYGTVPTKVLESSAIDRTDSEPFTISEIALNHWIYLSHFGRFNAVVQITNPGNGERYNLSMKEAFIFYLYAYNRGLGITLPHVPVVPANRVIREPSPTFEELRRLADVDVVPDYYIHHVISTQPSLTSFISIEAFRAFCRETWNVLFRHRELRFFASDYRKEGQLHTLVDRCYMDVRINLADEMPYDDWLEMKGISTQDLEPIDFMSMAQGILTSCTGADLQDTTSMKEIHSAMIRIMKSLSSYSVQYLSEINDSAIRVIDGKIPGISNNTYTETIDFIYDMYTPRVMDVKARYRSRHVVESGIGVNKVSFSDDIARIHVPVNIELLPGTKLISSMYVNGYFPVGSIRPMEERVIDSELLVNNPVSVLQSIGNEGPINEVGGYRISNERLTAFLNRG